MTKIPLSKGSMLRIEMTRQSRVISCQAGVYWITQEGDPQDHLLEAGEKLIIDRAGLVVVQGITDGAIYLETSPRLMNFTCVRERFPGDVR